MPKISPFLWFDNQAEQAAKFYVSIFKKDSKILSVQRYGAGGMGKKGSVMTVDFKLRGQRFTALNGGPHFKFNPAVSFVVDCKDQKEIDTLWAKLLAGGGAESQCGWLSDKYGLSWQIVPANISKLIDNEASMAAMMKMVKLDIQALKDAKKGAQKDARKDAKKSAKKGAKRATK
jgi:predicted 3-demethylubiquinone-9 3-methyltransferase (glyoxalase superfamily)